MTLIALHRSTSSSEGTANSSADPARTTMSRSRAGTESRGGRVTGDVPLDGKPRVAAAIAGDDGMLMRWSARKDLEPRTT